MADFRIKREEVGDRDFQRELEELMSDQLLRRRRRSSLAGDDLAESSAAALRQSRILSRWVARQTEEMITTIERRNRESELMALAGLHSVSTSFLMDDRRRSRSPPLPAAETPRTSPMVQMWREIEGGGNPTGGDQIRADLSESEYLDERSRSSRENSPDLGDERERVREMVSRITETRESRNESPRSEWLGENERERVRSVREWVRMTDHEEEGPQESVRRGPLRIRGRQARLDLIRRMASEREQELQGLEEHRAVSDFPHRNRIQVRCS